MRQLWWGLAALALAGCDYTIPLVKNAAIPIDQQLIGLWQQADAGNPTERLVVLPLGSREYLVVYPAGKPESMFARGCHWRHPSAPLMQVEWLGTAAGQRPRDNRTYQYVNYALAGDTLTVRLLNSDVVKRESPTAEALVQSILANRDHPDLYRKPMTFKRLPVE